jgi:MFS family permease
MKDATYKGYLLGLLVVILTFNLAEENALGILTQSIKLDLKLSDSELGLLSGIAFALFYSTMGIPIARWADSGNRVTIMAVTTALWSAAVALCGAARNLVQLMLIRVFAGVGEAGALPTVNSLIPDCFSRAERSRAMSISMLSGPLAVVLGYGVAGWTNQLYGWRATYLILGLPGLPLAALAALTLREPRRSSAPPASPRSQAQSSQPPSWRQVSVILWRNVTFRHLAFAYAIQLFFVYGIFQWFPAFFMRSYGLQSGELGTWLSVITVVAGGAGTYLGGELASRFAAGNEPLQLKVMAVMLVVATLLSAGIYLSHNVYAGYGLFAVYMFLGSTATGPLLAIKQTIVPGHLRATSFALVFLFSNLIGNGIGPLIGGVLSDQLHSAFGDESLRYALLILSPGFSWAAYHTWVASRTVLRDMKSEAPDDEGRADEQDTVVSATVQ